MSGLSSIRSKVLSNPLLMIWIIAGIVTIMVPPIRWHRQRNIYYKYRGRYNEYEQQQRNAENQNNQNYAYKYSPCKWYQWSCKRRYQKYVQYAQQNNNNNNNNNIILPEWYFAWGGSMQQGDEKEQEEQGLSSSSQQSGALKFCYAWTLILFMGLVLGWGAFCLYKELKYMIPVLVSMVLFSQFLIMQMILVVHGVIQTENRTLMNSVYGWYGQIGVLIFLSCRAYLIFCIIATTGMAGRAYWIFRQEKQRATGDAEIIAPRDVEMPQSYQPPEVRLTNNFTKPDVNGVLDSADNFLSKHGLMG